MIIDIQPKSELLRKHILGFNMFEERKDFHLHFFVFPQLGSTIRLSKNTKVFIEPSRIKLTPINKIDKNNNCYFSGVAGKYLEPIYLDFDGYVDGFAINFNPLGINYFFDKSYKKFAPKNFQEFSDRKWQNFAKELFSIKDFEGRVKFAETFLESIFNNINLVELEKAVEAILNDQTIHINVLAELCCMSARNLQRKFIEYVGCSPGVFKRIVRFRKSIDFNIWKDQHLNVTAICYTNNFFDTSHLRKDFLKLTHQNPKDFFKTISAVGNHKFPYKLL